MGWVRVGSDDEGLSQGRSGCINVKNRVIVVVVVVVVVVIVVVVVVVVSRCVPRPT